MSGGSPSPRPGVFVPAVAGALAGAAAAAALLVATDPGHGRSPDGDEPVVRAIREHAKAVEGALGELRAEITRSKAGSEARPAADKPTTAEAPASPPREEVPDPSSGLTAVKPPGTWGEPAHAERLQSLRRWERDADTRRQWMFSSEREVRDWFGTPHSIEPFDWGEHWIYLDETGKEVVRMIFRHGRLVNVNSPP